MKLFKKQRKKEEVHQQVHLNGKSGLDSLLKIQVPTGKTKEQAWNELVKKIQTSPKTIQPAFKYSFIGIAASFVLVSIGLSILYYSTNITLSCPQGQQMSVRLPDQSNVILNSETKLTYNKLIWKTKRTIYLHGEAFFTIQTGKSFDVKTNEAQVTVLGTSFNVFARKGEVKVNCVTGKVAVKNIKKESKTVILIPGKQTYFSSENLPSDPSNFDLTKAASWKNGEFYFDKDPIINVIDELERQYKVEVTYNGDTNRIYTGYFHNRDLNEALNLICLPMNLKYSKVDSNRIIITQ